MNIPCLVCSETGETKILKSPLNKSIYAYFCFSCYKKLYTDLSNSVAPIKPAKPGIALVHCKFYYGSLMDQTYMIQKMKYKEELALWEARLTDLVKPELAFGISQI